MRKNKDCNYDDINIFNEKLNEEITDNIMTLWIFKDYLMKALNKKI